MQLLHGDCLELMQTIPEHSVDLVLTDLPYGVTRNSWDRPISLPALWEQWKRVCKPHAAVVLNAQEPFTSDLVNSNRKDFKYKWVWYKKQCSGFLNAKKQPLRNCEDILVFYHKQCTYNPQMREGKLQVKATGRGSDCYNKFTFKPHTCSTYYPTILLEIPLARYKDGHPTQKPVALQEYLILTYTNPGDVVLDCCMGSGSTGVACANTGREFIGIELDEGYFRMACERINERRTQ